MLKSCKYCGRIHDSKYECEKKYAQKLRKKETTEQTKLRSCRKWAKARAKANKRDHYLCRVCLAQGKIVYAGLETHHIVPLAEDDSLAYELDNLITLCYKHHKAAERGEIDADMLKSMAKEEVLMPPGVLMH